VRTHTVHCKLYGLHLAPGVLFARRRLADACRNQLVMNYLVVEGYKDAAEHFRVESCTNPGTDLEAISDRMVPTLVPVPCACTCLAHSHQWTKSRTYVPAVERRLCSPRNGTSHPCPRGKA
jgi:hypothetical protein